MESGSNAARRRAILELATEPGQGPVRGVVRGECMEPHLLDGDRVEIVRRRAYWPGDVVALFSTDGRFLVHRLFGYRFGRGGILVVTGADRAAGFDAPVPVREVLGRVESRECGGWVPVRAGLILRAQAVLRYLRGALGAAARWRSRRAPR
jgi:hypothetical protein